MENAKLKKMLYEAYKKDPSNYGAKALAKVFSEVDISTFDKRNLDTIITFIDVPERIMQKDIPLSAFLQNFKRQKKAHMKNLAMLYRYLPDFSLLDPKQAIKNEYDAKLFAKAITSMNLKEEWKDGNLESYKTVVRKAVVIFLVMNELQAKLGFLAPEYLGNNLCEYNREFDAIFFQDNKEMFENFGFSGTVAACLHEVTHVKQYKKVKEKDVRNILYFCYYYEPKRKGREDFFSYLGNYLEMEANDIEERLKIYLKQMQNEGR